MLGLLEDHRLRVRTGFRGPGTMIYLLGETLPELGGSEFAEAVLGTVSGRPPALDLGREAALHAALVDAAGSDLLVSAHDCGDGGLAIALAESAIAGDTGFAVSLPEDAPWYVTLFSESASRVVVSVDEAKAAAFEALAERHGVPFARIGETGGPRISIDGLLETTVEVARETSTGILPAILDA